MMSLWSNAYIFICLEVFFVTFNPGTEGFNKDETSDIDLARLKKKNETKQKT